VCSGEEEEEYKEQHTRTNVQMLAAVDKVQSEHEK
jgi:hypothetical protein